jgi:pimeloyl-ACP methyl ester carboxylesterase
MFEFDAKEKRVTVCLVHGNPETAAVWDRLAPLLDRGPVVRLSPPGFGAPVPPGFTATVEEYRRWLVAELERFGQPVHLVGHDWGGAHVVNVAMTRPELVRSWVCDVILADGDGSGFKDVGDTQIREPDLGEKVLTNRRVSASNTVTCCGVLSLVMAVSIRPVDLRQLIGSQRVAQQPAAY